MTAPAMFDIVAMPTDVATLPLPENGPYYVAGRDGYLIMRDTAFGRALVPVDKMPHLSDQGSALWAKIPTIPAGLIGQVWSFFRTIWIKRQSEAMVYLTRKDDIYRIFVPPQQTSGGGVKADLDLTKIQKGWRIVGTMHSHCNFGAYHSGTDTHDADGHDGLHVTIGHVDRNDSPEYAIMLSFNKIRWNCELTDITNETPALVAHPEWWERYVRDPDKTAIKPVDIHNWRNDSPGGWSLAAPDNKAPTTWERRVIAAGTNTKQVHEFLFAEDAVESIRRNGQWPSTTLEPDEVDAQSRWIDRELAELADAADEIGLTLDPNFIVNSFGLTDTRTHPRTHSMTDAEWRTAIQEYD